MIDAAESGETDAAFDNIDLTSGNLSQSKNTRNVTKNYLMACLQAGLQRVSEANSETALGLANAYRRMNGEPSLDVLAPDFKVFAIKLHHGTESPDIEIFIKRGEKVLYGEKVLPRGILIENFLQLTGATLF